MKRAVAERLVLLIAIGLILEGFALVFVGSFMSGQSGGCLFWPLPVIFVCGVGSAGAADLLIIVTTIALLLFSFSSLFLPHRPKEDPTSP